MFIFIILFIELIYYFIRIIINIYNNHDYSSLYIRHCAEHLDKVFLLNSTAPWFQQMQLYHESSTPVSSF